MHQLDERQQGELRQQFRERVSFHPTERRLYGHDVGTMPRRIKPLLGDTTPDAVVQPESEAELVELVRWAALNRVPLTPRAKATSGYGGVVPTRHGLVVDLRRLNRVLEIDEGALTATVQPAVVWEPLDKRLAERGLTLRLYPSSYPASSVGGWLAQAGAGYGSYQYGWFRDNVVAARVVLPSGEVRVLDGLGLDLVSGAEGITGFITEVTLKVMRHEELAIAAISCPTAASAAQVLGEVVAEQLPVWSLGFADPAMVELTGRCPPRAHPHEEHVVLPQGYLVVVAMRQADDDAAFPILRAIAERAGAHRIGDDLARHEWAQRFRIMRVKRLGPSLVPAEVVVPMESLRATLEELAEKVKQPLVIDGIAARTAAGKTEVVLLGFIPQDERTLGYDLVFGLALTVIAIAERHGGRAYSTGLYFRHKADAVLGAGVHQRLSDLKRELDPADLMNPGKVLGSGVLSAAIHAAEALEPAVRLGANAVKTALGEHPGAAKRGIPADVAEYAYACAQCGYCVDDCEQFSGRGWESQSPRGKWFFLREYLEGREEMSQMMVDSFLSCTTCELCNTRCPLGLPIEPSWLKLRGQLIHEEGRMTFPPFEIMSAAVTAEGDIWAGYRRDRAAWFPEDLLEKHGPSHHSRNVYFAGCTASYVEHDIGIGSVRLLDAAGVDFTYLGENESCCATPMLVAGKWEVFADTLKKNIAAVKQAGADTVISSCPACDMMWRQVYPQWAKKLGIDYGITAKHYSELVADKLKDGSFRFPDAPRAKTDVVTWHDSCHIGRASGVYQPPRDVLQALPGVELREMEHNREQAKCCGSVLTLLKEPQVAHDLGKARLDEAEAVGAEKVVALCPCCEFQLRVSAEARHSPVEVIDLSRFAAERLGFTLPDPHPEVRAQWAVFEKMIAMLTPSGFAALLGTMWAELIAAMPLHLGGMMRVMARVPGVLELMKPLFPALFPLLLPKMMPKLLPVFLDRIGKQVPMPAYMAEQMPTLIPGVMDALMPHMLPDVVPLISDPLVTYLRAPRA
ncbi:MAG: FAD-binding oxidoreductase [Archangiaceae bacterium]|nr:FAD-binding oxidoreductase [Archangiaceae bacterium]